MKASDRRAQSLHEAFSHDRNLLTSGLSQSLIYSILIFLFPKMRPHPGVRVKLRMESLNISAWEFLGKYTNLNMISAFSYGNPKLVYCLAPVSNLSEAVEPTACPVKDDQVILFGGVSYIALGNDFSVMR